MDDTHVAASADGPDGGGRVLVGLPTGDAARVLPFNDMLAHVSPPLAMQCYWSPNGMFVRVTLANLSDRELTGVRISPRTTAGQPLWMEAARDTDLTRIAPRSHVMMGVRTYDDEPGDLPLVVQVTYAPDGKVLFDGVMPESAERY